MRLIDADELKKHAIPCEIHNGGLTDLCVPLYQIDNAPTVEEFPTTCPNCDSGYAQGYSGGYLQGKEEKPTGEWEKPFEHRGRLYHKCSNCHLTSAVPTAMGEPMYKYCPNCGAKMKGASND